MLQLEFLISSKAEGIKLILVLGCAIIFLQKV